MSEKRIVTPYKIVKLVLDRNNLNDFEIMPNRRAISESHVTRISGALWEGRNPLGILIVNYREKKYRLIDGNHRFEALKRYFLRVTVKDVKVEVNLKVYDGLTDDEERQVYSDEARRLNESYDDRLNLYKDVLTIWKLVNDPLVPFPVKVTIYPNRNALRFRNIINAIYTARMSKTGGYIAMMPHKDKLIEFASDIQYEDFIKMKNFIEMFIKVYGNVSKENMFSYNQFFVPLFDIYYKNIQYKKDDNFEERFKRVVGRTEIMNMAHEAGRESQGIIRRLLITYMNKGFVTRKFV